MPKLQNDRKEWTRVSAHSPGSSEYTDLSEFAKSYVSPGGFGERVAYGFANTKLIWVERFDEKQHVFFRQCLHGDNCKVTLRFRPAFENDEVLWVIEQSGLHDHAQLSKRALHDLAVEYGVKRRLTADRAILEIHSDLPGTQLPETFKRTVDNVRLSHFSGTKFDGRILGILQAFLASLPVGLFLAAYVLEPSPMIPFMIPGLDSLAAQTMRSFSGLNMVIDGTYKINREDLVLMALCLVGLRLTPRGIVNQIIPIFFMLARVEEHESWKFLFEAAVKHYSEKFGLDISTRVRAVFRDCSAGAEAACFAVFGNDIQVFRDLEHVKRNIIAWAAKHRSQIKNCAVVESIVAKVAFSAPLLIFEFNIFWAHWFLRLEELEEHHFLAYLREFIFSVDGDFIEAKWRCCMVCSPPGFFVYLNNTIERKWRTIENYLPKYKKQDITTLMTELGKIFHGKLQDRSYEGLVDAISDQPHKALICGRGMYPTVEEIGSPGIKRTRRLTSKALLDAIEANGTESVMEVRRFNPPFVWLPGGEDIEASHVVAVFVVPIYSVSALETDAALGSQYADIVLSNSLEECVEAMMPNGVFVAKDYAKMHRMFTVIIVQDNGVFDVQRRFMQRSQTEALFLIRHLEHPGLHGTVCLRTIAMGGHNRRARAKAKSRARAKRISRRELGDSLLDPEPVREEEADDSSEGENGLDDRSADSGDATPGQHEHEFCRFNWVQRRRCCLPSCCSECLVLFKRNDAWACRADLCPSNTILCASCLPDDVAQYSDPPDPPSPVLPCAFPPSPEAMTAMAAAMATVRFVSAEPTIFVDADN